MKLNKVDCNVLHLCRNNHQSRLGAKWLESSIIEKTLGDPGGHQVEPEQTLCLHGKED